jgi:beta-lactamase regulating signal transducer with metallopeptidase domain/protein involved in polysaccharide export with SLBB domain
MSLNDLGWTLLHSLWQGAAIAILVALLRAMVRSVRLRYAIGVTGLVVMAIAPAVTMAVLYAAKPVPTAIAAPTATAKPVAEPLAVAVPQAVTSVVPTAARPVAPAIDWRDALPVWTSLAWMTGVVVLAAWHAVGLVGVARLRSRCRSVDDASLLAALRRLSRAIGVRAAVPLLACDRVLGPCVVGVVRPAILWPVALLSNLTPRQVELLLAHELAHVRRLDPLVNHLQTLLETLMFYHPCVWWLSRRVRADRELCCDAIAAKAVDDDRAGLAGALVALADAQQSRLGGAARLALGARGGSLGERVRALLDAPARRSPRSGRIVSIIVGACVAIGVASSYTSLARADAATKPADVDPVLARLTAERDELSARANAIPAGPEEVKARESLRELDERIVRRQAFWPAGREAKRRAEERREKLVRERGERDPRVAAYDWQIATLAMKLDGGVEDADLFGEYYMGGRVQRVGAYSLTDRTITLSQALIGAGGPDEKDDLWVRIDRRGFRGHMVDWTLEAPLPVVSAREFPKLALLPGDTVMVVSAPSSAPSTAPATQAARVDERVAPKIAANDRLNIFVVHPPEGSPLGWSRAVSSDGAITLPSGGRIKVAGLDSVEAAAAITRELRSAGWNAANSEVWVEFTPNKQIAEAAGVEPPIAPGDALRVEVMDLAGPGQRSTFDVTTRRDGIITLMYLPPLRVVGLSLDEARDVIGKAYVEANVLAKPQLTVSRMVAPPVAASGNGPVDAVSSGQPSAVPAEVAPDNDRSLAAIQNQIDALATELQVTIARSGEGHPRVKELREQVALLNSRLAVRQRIVADRAAAEADRRRAEQANIRAAEVKAEADRRAEQLAAEIATVTRRREELAMVLSRLEAMRQALVTRRADLAALQNAEPAFELKRVEDDIATLSKKMLDVQIELVEIDARRVTLIQAKDAGAK